ncbi:MAG: carbon storage regulator CsrA [Clostridia bacterium]|jgi:carbon storage regulator|nr:carbon storage regulator CsrA [Clostridia bacterium]
MLVLTRRRGQSILIGEHIRVTIVGLGEDQVRVGIEAPKGISIYREEIYEAIRRANLEAAHTSALPEGQELPRPSSPEEE